MHIDFAHLGVIFYILDMSSMYLEFYVYLLSNPVIVHTAHVLR